MHLSRSILALMSITLLAVPALAASGNSTGNAGGAGNAAGAATGERKSKADEKPKKVPQDDRVAREAVKKSQVLSLEAVTALVGNASTGRVLDIQLLQFEGEYVYEVVVLEADGRLHKLCFNARSGASVDPR